MLLDLDNPDNVVAALTHPLLEPDQIYENTGFKSGVVYTNGAVVKDGELIVYYGSADTYVSVAHIPLDELLDVLRRGSTKDIGDRKDYLVLNGLNGMSNIIIH